VDFPLLTLGIFNSLDFDTARFALTHFSDRHIQHYKMGKVKKNLPAKQRHKAQKNAQKAPKSLSVLTLRPSQKIASIKAKDFQALSIQPSNGNHIFNNRITELSDDTSDSDLEYLPPVLPRRRGPNTEVDFPRIIKHPAPGSAQDSHLISSLLSPPDSADSRSPDLTIDHNQDDTPSPVRVIDHCIRRRTEPEVQYTRTQLITRRRYHSWTLEEQGVLCLIVRFFQAGWKVVAEIMNARFSKCLSPFKSTMLVSQFHELRNGKSSKQGEMAWQSVFAANRPFDQTADRFESELYNLSWLAGEHGIFGFKRRIEDDPHKQWRTPAFCQKKTRRSRRTPRVGLSTILPDSQSVAKVSRVRLDTQRQQVSPTRSTGPVDSGNTFDNSTLRNPHDVLETSNSSGHAYVLLTRRSPRPGDHEISKVISKI
jgi:hypothetical protein